MLDTNRRRRRSEECTREFYGCQKWPTELACPEAASTNWKRRVASRGAEKYLTALPGGLKPKFRNGSSHGPSRRDITPPRELRPRASPQHDGWMVGALGRSKTGRSQTVGSRLSQDENSRLDNDGDRRRRDRKPRKRDCAHCKRTFVQARPGYTLCWNCFWHSSYWVDELDRRYP